MADPRQIIDGLVARGMPYNAAVAFAGNFQAESGLNPGINEIAPTVPGSRGGFGLAQWTGPRRTGLEGFAQQRGVPASDLNLQLDYLMQELSGPEQRAAQSIYGAQSAEDAARLVSEQFLRPGIPNMDARLAATRQFAGMGPGNSGGILQPGHNQPQNALGVATGPTPDQLQQQRQGQAFNALMASFQNQPTYDFRLPSRNALAGGI